MTNSARIPWWHWAVLFSAIPFAGAAVSFFFLVHHVEHPFVSAAVVAGLVAMLVDYARRSRLSAAVAGAFAGALVIPFAFGLFIALLLISCSTGGCNFD